MKSWALNVYHRLPSWSKSMVASAHGLRLRSTRYGPALERMVAAVLERDYWSEEQWETWRRERLAHLLNRAVELAPHYRDLWRDRPGDSQRLIDWPILEKAALKAEPNTFIVDGQNPRRMVEDHTSGTTGTPLRVWMNRDCVRDWYSIYEARCRRWNDVSWRDRWVNIGGQLVAPIERRKPPFWVFNAPLRQLYMSSYHLSPDLIPHYLDRLARFQPAFLLGYTSSLHALAQTMLETDRRDVRPKAVMTNAEPLRERQRRDMAEAFGCPVRETYGMSEMAGAASECSEGRLHLWPDVGIVEVVDEQGDLVPDGETGDFVLTGLLNFDMPLIRYRVGDRGALAPRDEPPCPCGRTLPRLARVEGRSDDMLLTADGRRIGRLDPVFKADLPMREAQIIQESIDRLRVIVVPAPGFDSGCEQLIAQRLRERMGPMSIEFERVAEVPRERNGKFRAVVCRIPPASLKSNR